MANNMDGIVMGTCMWNNIHSPVNSDTNIWTSYSCLAGTQNDAR
ncbi:hypothetical protein [Mucilaginibacter lappiensis]